MEACLQQRDGIPEKVTVRAIRNVTERRTTRPLLFNNEIFYFSLRCNFFYSVFLSFFLFEILEEVFAWLPMQLLLFLDTSCVYLSFQLDGRVFFFYRSVYTYYIGSLSLSFSFTGRVVVKYCRWKS